MAEHLYYIYQLSLSTTQSSQFLASLSSNAQASDDYLRTLTPTGATDRRTSVAGPTSSAARTALFQLRVTLIEAFLDHGVVARTIDHDVDEAQATIDALAEVGVDLDDVTHRLEEEGVSAFVKAFDELIATLDAKRPEL